jgi:hypothetical protein
MHSAASSKDGLHDEHTVPYSLGGNTELLEASCTDCEAITSYLDGYVANAIFGHLRVHMDLQSRSGHDASLGPLAKRGAEDPADCLLPREQRAVCLNPTVQGFEFVGRQSHHDC